MGIFKPVGPVMQITSCDGNTLLEINNIPAPIVVGHSGRGLHAVLPRRAAPCERSFGT